MTIADAPVADTIASLTLAESEPSQIVLRAIEAANYATTGAPFNPLLIAVAKASDFTNIWFGDRGDTAIAFYQFNGQRTDGFLALGDQAVLNNAEWASVPVLLVKPMTGYEDALANPTGFTWILDDSGSGNANGIAYFWPVAPTGYIAVGIVVAASGETPSTANYWCVRSELLQSAATVLRWSDFKSNWTHNGSLSVPVLNKGEAPTEEEGFLLAPTTLLSDEYTSDSGATNSSVLVLSKCMLPMDGGGVPDPEYLPGATEGTTTPMGVGNVAVLPCSSINDPDTGSSPSASPFYYLAAQPSWTCTGSYSPPAGGTYPVSALIMIGTPTEQSTSIGNTTSLTVGAEVGVEAGPLSVSVAVSYTQEMSVTTVCSEGSQTEVSEAIELAIPGASTTQIWQRVVDLCVYRTDGISLIDASYRTSDLLIVQSPTSTTE